MWLALKNTEGSGGYDISIDIKNSNPEFDKKIKTILWWIFPTQGGKVYNILDSGFSTQTLTLDNRKVTLKNEYWGYGLRIGPIIK